jgi:hypothetical protein
MKKDFIPKKGVKLEYQEKEKKEFHATSESVVEAVDRFGKPVTRMTRQHYEQISEG